MFTSEDIFISHEVLGEERDNSLDTMCIAFASDAGYVGYLGILMTSLVLNNKSLFLKFYLILDELKVEDYNRLQLFIKTYTNVEINILLINDEPFHSFETTQSLSLAIYYRLMIPTLLKNKVKKILYLDADIICLRELDQLRKFDFDNNCIMAVKDEACMAEQAQKRLSHFNASNYFNSGVIYIDVDKCYEEKIFEKALLCLQSGCKLEHFDQDALNIVLQDKVLYIGKEYNYRYVLAKDKQVIPENTIFVHYTTPHKPWYLWFQDHPAAQKYLDYKEKSLWCDVPAVMPKNSRQKRYIIKYFLRKKEYTNAFKWLYKYLFSK